MTATVVLLGGPLDGTELAAQSLPPHLEFNRISDWPLSAVIAGHSEPLDPLPLHRESYRRMGWINKRRHVYRYEGTS